MNKPVREIDNDPGSPGLPSRQEAFLSGVLLAFCKQSPAMYAYLRDAEVGSDGKCWLIFFKLPPDVVRNLAQVVNVEKKKAYEFQQHGVFFTALSMEPSEEEMRTLQHHYHDKEDEGKKPVVGPDEQGNSTTDRLAGTRA